MLLIQLTTLIFISYQLFSLYPLNSSLNSKRTRFNIFIFGYIERVLIHFRGCHATTKQNNNNYNEAYLSLLIVKRLL